MLRIDRSSQIVGRRVRFPGDVHLDCPVVGPTTITDARRLLLRAGVRGPLCMQADEITALGPVLSPGVDQALLKAERRLACVDLTGVTLVSRGSLWASGVFTGCRVRVNAPIEGADLIIAGGVLHARQGGVLQRVQHHRRQPATLFLGDTHAKRVAHARAQTILKRLQALADGAGGTGAGSLEAGSLEAGSLGAGSLQAGSLGTGGLDPVMVERAADRARAVLNQTRPARGTRPQLCVVGLVQAGTVIRSASRQTVVERDLFGVSAYCDRGEIQVFPQAPGASPEELPPRRIASGTLGLGGMDAGQECVDVHRDGPLTGSNF